MLNMDLVITTDSKASHSAISVPGKSCPTFKDLIVMLKIYARIPPTVTDPQLTEKRGKNYL